MKLSPSFPVVLLCISTVKAHYYWPWLIVNGTQYPQWKYVRNVTPGDGYGDSPTQGKAEPHIDLYSTNFTCGRNAFQFASTTETADVIAGSEVGFRINQGIPDDQGPEYSGLNHPGPALIYLARAPNDDLTNFSGIDGDWFKIAELLAKTDNSWVVQKYDQRIVNFTIPANTPPGKYLLRFEHMSPRSYFMQTQFFLNCAQVNIIGPGGGSLDGYPFAKFPGAYDYMHPGIYVSQDVANWRHITNYVAPGPPLWQG